MKKIIGYIVLTSIVLLSGCKKETLDFTSDKYYNIEQFLKSSNCDTDCQKAASCEGKIVKVEGKIEGFDAPTNTSCDRKFILKIDDEEKVASE